MLNLLKRFKFQNSIPSSNPNWEGWRMGPGSAKFVFSLQRSKQMWPITLSRNIWKRRALLVTTATDFVQLEMLFIRTLQKITKRTVLHKSSRPEDLFFNRLCIFPKVLSLSTEHCNFSDLDDLIRSKMKKLEDGQWQCLDCFTTTKVKTNIFEHIEARHVQSPGYVCFMCQKHCRTRNALRAHKNRYHSAANHRPDAYY